MKTKYILCTFLLQVLCCNVLWAQVYKVDETGYIADSAFHRILKNKGILLLCNFGKPVSDGRSYAWGFTKSGWSRIDNAGNIIEFASTGKTVIAEADNGINVNSGNQVVSAPVVKEDPAKIFYSKVENGKFGTRNDAGETGIPFLFDGLEYFSQGIVKVHTGKKYGLYYTNGKELLPALYDQVNTISHDKKQRLDLFIVKKDGRYGIVKNKGKTTVPFIYDAIGNTSGYNVFVSKDTTGKWNLINEKGQKMSVEYDWIDSYFSLPAMKITTGIAYKDKRYGLLDHSGKEITAPVYNDIRRMSYHYSIATERKDYRQKEMLINNFTGKVQEKTYLSIEDAKNGYSRLRTQDPGRFGFIDTLGQEVIKPVYEGIGDMINKNGLVEFKEDGKWGVLNKEGKVVLPASYSHIQLFFRVPMAAGIKDTLTSLFTSDGKPLFEGKPFGSLEETYDELFINNLKGREGVIDQNGKVIIAAAYEEINSRTGYFIVIREGLSGLADRTGRKILPVRYQRIIGMNTDLGPGLYLVLLNGKTLVTDRYGNELPESVTGRYN